eukprot:TRINITY_DN349_c0_g1_i8.p1 TRINITY_DN349_c0_g1~~TRINITY_DN349_c0_g1_i8.p1  ORF type:complete len:1376 (+),score=263.96 TRINITY_DN349_c0_g1_i8:789-4916(+)
MRGGVLLVTALFILGSHAGGFDFIVRGNEDIVTSEVGFNEFNFGSNWRGPAQSTVYINYRYDEAATNEFGEPDQSFQYYPPGETTPIPLTFSLIPEDFLADPLVFPVIQNDPRICGSITKRAPINQICIQGDTACNGGYEYVVTVGVDNLVDRARTNIEYIGGNPPVLVQSSEVLRPTSNTLYGKLGATFQVSGSETVLINATDFQGEPRGSIEWFFRAGGTGAETQLPGSLAGVTITNAGDGQSILSLSGVNAAHVGEYIAVATNEHGEDRASAFVTQGVAPFITEGSGQSGSSSFRVGANRDVNPGETITIRAEDSQSNPSSTITWSYSRSESGPYSAITSGGPYSISSSSGSGNVGTDSRLRISNVGSGQYGYYRATAVNPHGTVTSSSSLIGRSPQLNLGSGIETDGNGNIGSDYLAGIGSTVTIRAQDLTGFPTSSFRWQRFNSLGLLTDITTGGRYRITTNGANSELRITGVTPSELGTYRATASNAFGDSTGESLVGTPSGCNSGSNIVRVNNGATYESGASFDTTNANSFRIRGSDPTGVPTGTSSFQYSRTPSGPRSAVNGAYAVTATPIGAAGTIDFFNLVDGAYGYYHVTNSNQFGSAECSNLVGSQLAFRTGSGQIGQNYQVAPGSSQAITASFSDGFPYGEIVWRRPNGQIITSSTPGYTIALGNGVSQLVINSARSIDYGTYTATASNTFGSVTASSVVSETVVVIPPVIEEGSSDTINEASGGVVEGDIGESFSAGPGETVTIAVNDIAGREPSSIRFFRSPPGSQQFVDITDNPAYTITTTQGADGFTDSTISFTAGPDTYGTFRAQASNSAGSDAAISQVGQAPRIPDIFNIVRIVSGQSRTVDVGGQIYVQEGGSVTLSADDIEGQPARNFIWTYRNDPTDPFGPLPSSTRINQGVSGTTGLLTINNIDRTIYGEYRVVATNEFGESDPVTTIVGAPPIIRFSSGTVTSGQGEIGNDFIIPNDNRLRIMACVVGGYPPADPRAFRFEEQGVLLNSVQQPRPNDNCFFYEEGEFEITCGTTISTRTENIFGSSNTPSSQVIFPPPTIEPGTATCSQGSSQASAQIGSDLCLYGRDTFDISCSVERINIPAFTFQWLFNGVQIQSGGKYTIREADRQNSLLTVTGITVDDTGRYGCRVVSTCGETNLESTDVSTYNYDYICNEVAGTPQCLESVNGGPPTIVLNSVCEALNLPRPPCDICDWVMTPWSECSDPTCHRGRRNREVTCECNLIARPDDDCVARPKPATVDRCGPLGVRCNRPCQWKEYNFGSCSRTCGASFRDRRVECVDLVTDNRVNEDCCNVLFKPDGRQTCDVPPCNQCVDLMDSRDCDLFVTLVGNCDPYPYSVRRSCCATCSQRGL